MFCVFFFNDTATTEIYTLSLHDALPISAALTALALFGAFMTSAQIRSIDISKAVVMAGLFLGGMLPFLFSSMAMNAVGRAAMAMIEEVRRQFKDIPELTNALKVMKKNDGKEKEEWSDDDKVIFEKADGKAEYGKCVEISTKAALRQMVLPGLLAISAPVFIGFVRSEERRVGKECRSRWSPYH